MIAAATAFLSATLAGIGGTAVEVEVAGRTETATRAVVLEDGKTQAVAYLDLLPRLDLRLAGKTRRVELGYEPQLRGARELGGAASDAGVAHAANARAEWDLLPGWRISGAGRASERLVDLATASAGELTRLLELGGAPTTIRYGEAAASAGVEGGLAPRLALASSVAFDASGGLGAAGRAAVPALRRLRVAAGLVRDQTRRDVLRVDASALQATFDGGETASLATFTGEWAHDAARTLRLRIAGGASAVRAEGDPARALPEGRAAVEWTPAFLGRPVHAAASISAGAAIDRWRTTVYERLAVDGDLSWAPWGGWTLRALTSRGWAREPTGPTAARGDLRAAWRASPRLTLSGGVFGEWQSDPGLAAVRSVSSWGTTFGVELAPLGRFTP